MQDTAEGFGQPIRHMFGSFFRMERDLPAATDAAPRYRVRIEDRIVGLALSADRDLDAVDRGSSRPAAGWQLSIYLLYSFFTLIALLVLVFAL